MNRIDLMLARAQIGLAFFFGLAFVSAVLMLMLSIAHVVDLPNGANALLTGMAATLGTIVTLQQNYFFARHRPGSTVDPADDGTPAPPVPSTSGAPTP